MKKNILVGLVLGLLFAGTSEGKIPSDFLMVSAERGVGGVYGIYFTYGDGEKWSQKITVSETEQQQIHPTLIRNNGNGDIMLAWTRFSGTNGMIHSRFYSSATNSWHSVRSLITKTSSDMGPSLAQDESGEIWLAYSGVGDKGDDIYVSRWNGSGWSLPFMVNREDNSPDIQPVFGYTDSGGLRLVWKGYSEGGYVNFCSDLVDEHWSVEQQLAVNMRARSAAEKKTYNLDNVYTILPTGSQAAILDLRESHLQATHFNVGE